MLKRLLKRLGLLRGARYLANKLTGYDASYFAQRQAMLEFYSRFIREGDLCFDIGAHTGNRTEIFLQLGATTVCLEPQASCLRELREAFGGDSRMILVPEGVSDKEGKAQLWVCGDLPVISTLSEKMRSGSRFSGESRWGAPEEIRTTTLDALISRYGMPAFCKIDVEGSEEAVIRGLSQPIPAISFEYMKEFAGETKNSLDRLSSIAPYEFNFSAGESMVFAHSAWLSAPELLAALNAAQDPLLWGDIYARLPGRGGEA